MTNIYYADTAVNASFPIGFSGNFQSLPISFSIEIAGPSVLVDNSTYPLPGLMVVVPMGYKSGDLKSLPDGQDICNEGYGLELIHSGIAAPCDFDGDSCVEYQVNRTVIPHLNGEFTFRNVSASVPISSSAVQIPQNVFAAMNDSSGADLLFLNISGTAEFVYGIDDRKPAIGSCSDNFTTQSFSIPIAIKRNFSVSGRGKLFFLTAPITREQWVRDNHFDNIILSQSELYHVDIFLNNNKTHNITLRTFDLVNDRYGLMRIVSNKSDQTSSALADQGILLFENKNFTNPPNPVPLELGNSSFAYIYYINSTYAGLGENNLTISVNDSFLGAANRTEVLTSKFLSYDGTHLENGGSFNYSTTRKSASFDVGVLNPITLSALFVGVILFAIFANFWRTTEPF
ncbi:hypothetical protein HY988_05175 [Candidatus Micrarchaeota archaeon]|nr:hypothetical protein [Candidatus Micrarchaeota archaeon]